MTIGLLLAGGSYTKLSWKTGWLSPKDTEATSMRRHGREGLDEGTLMGKPTGDTLKDSEAGVPQVPHVEPILDHLSY